ncbi:single-strand DNA-binding protein [Arthrobacter sp. cf158]|uniref:single-stranded DNA-binding protein n=1 Tax=Arthrobacter sp. cf158 TaxID=1761744 RepID=UPI000896AD60|nr:single-stranded DNA-binding protein [Arthrobacter sp. cf158]SDW34058.1 single-strand DNA-binding protein [Arthrobacter sp. cf158]
MAGETLITIIGKVHDDPEQKFNVDGSAVTRLTVVTNPRKYNKQTNKWENMPGKFWPCRAWNQGQMLLADNVSNTLKKGDNVILHGEIETQVWEDAQGTKRRGDQIRIEAIGKDLRWHQAPANDVPATHQPAADPGGWGGEPQANQGGWG